MQRMFHVKLLMRCVRRRNTRNDTRSTLFTISDVRDLGQNDRASGEHHHASVGGRDHDAAHAQTARETVAARRVTAGSIWRLATNVVPSAPVTPVEREAPPAQKLEF